MKDNKYISKEQIENFIKEVEEVRKKKGITQAELSQLAYGNIRSYHEALKFRNMPSIETLNKLAGALGRHVIVCLSEDD